MELSGLNPCTCRPGNSPCKILEKISSFYLQELNNFLIKFSLNEKYIAKISRLKPSHGGSGG